MLLAEHGAAVVLGARREEHLAVVAGEISAAGGRVGYRVTDVTRRQDLQALVDLAYERFGRLDVLVNNAGIGPISRFDALRVATRIGRLRLRSRRTQSPEGSGSHCSSPAMLTSEAS